MSSDRQDSERYVNILRLHHEGYRPRAIIAILSVSRTHVYRVLATAGVRPNPSPAYLSRADREEIVAMLQNGAGQKYVAEWLGVTQQRVSQIAAEMGVGHRPRKQPFNATPPQGANDERRPAEHPAR